MTRLMIVVERPILMSPPMVRATLRDIDPKTQTRRFYTESVLPEGLKSYQQEQMKLIDGIVHGRKAGETEFKMMVGGKGPRGEGNPERCPYGAPGDRLWVRESGLWSDAGFERSVAYRADGEPDASWVRPLHWKPSIHMPRWASRLTLEVTGVRVERLQEISEADAIAEGIPAFKPSPSKIPRLHYASLWDSLNAKRGFGWDKNPWVWVVEFKRVTA